MPSVSVILATRDRPEPLKRAVASVLASTVADLELVVVDQGREDALLPALAEFASDPRLRHVHSQDSGQARAINLGLRLTTAPLVALTDDDCEVAADWLETLTTYFDAHPKVALIYGRVAAPVGLSIEDGYLPQFGPPRTVPTPLTLKPGTRSSVFGAMGANMSFRRALVEAIGPFDEALGPGGILESGTDLDFGIRAIAAGHVVLAHPGAVVVHAEGLRNRAQAPAMWRRNGVGLGGMLVKGLRGGQLAEAAFVTGTLVAELAQAIPRLAHPGASGLRRVGYNLLGIAVGARRASRMSAVGHGATRVFAPPGQPSWRTDSDFQQR